MSNKIINFIENIGKSIINKFNAIKKYLYFIHQIIKWLFKKPFRIGLIFKQLEFVGNKSIGIVSLASTFTGAVIGLQIGKIFGLFRAEGLMGASTSKALALELAPVMCGFIVAGRAGAAMAAEIGTMRVNEQIDAMESMGVSPISYLVIPRVLGGMIMLPVLSGLFLFLGSIGCFIVGRIFFNIDMQQFESYMRMIVWVSDIRKGLFKAMIFGFIFASVSCYKGFFAKGGAKGVGEATTQAVVISLLSILISDFFITFFQQM